MGTEAFLGSGGTFHRALIFMLKLGWQSRFRLPMLLIFAFVTLDYGLQVEIELEDLGPHNYLTSNVICFVVSMVILALATRSTPRTIESADLTNRVRGPVIITHDYPNMIKGIDNTDDSDGRFCEIEYQVMKKRAGKCMKLGHGITGCISDDYMNPFHPDCF
ncbi:hypothetical protein ANTRET_LOCUS6704 [Anthophora retusa]